MIICPKLSAQSSTMEVRVTNIKELQGNLMIAIYDSKETFTSTDVVSSAKVKVEDEEQTVAFENIAYGEYAVILYHDVNSNGELDTNFFKIPSEPYGFSNGSGFLGIPSYVKSKFDFDGDAVEISLN